MRSARATTELPVMAATEAYEGWLRERLDVVEADLQYKHQQMAASLFAFLRGTFYRWAALWEETCPDLAKAPRLMAVGDLHVQNFGTWCDLEGRLVWGVNDLDEVATMPYAVDLVRTVTSAMIAKREKDLTIDEDLMAAAVLEGYSQSLEAGGNPFVLEESHPALRDMAMGAERDPVPFWSKLAKLPAANPPKRIKRLLEGELPDNPQGMGGAPVGTALRPHRTDPIPQEPRRARDSQIHGARDRQYPSRVAGSMHQGLARSLRAEAGLAAGGGPSHGQGDRAGLAGFPLGIQSPLEALPHTVRTVRWCHVRPDTSPAISARAPAFPRRDPN
jgi:hypothetical protein